MSDTAPSSPARSEVWKRPVVHLALAVLGVVAVTLVRYPLEPLLQGRAPYALYYVPVLVAAWHSGVVAAAAILLSSGAGWLYALPHDPAGRPATLALFLLASGALVALARAARRMRRQEDEALATARRAQWAADFAVWESDLSGALVRSEGLSRLVDPNEGADEASSRERFQSWIHPDDRLRYERQLQRAREAGTQLRAEFRVEDPRRAPRWLASIGEALRDASGRPTGMAGVFLDVTERKRAEETRAYLAAIVESCEDAIVACDLDGVIQSCNAEAERLFGYPEAQLVGRPVALLTQGDRQQMEAGMLEQVCRGERVDHFETVRLARDGRDIDVSLTMSPIRDAAGAIVGASAVVRDVTERRRAAEALAARSDWYRLTLASIGDAVIASDLEGRVTFMNALGESLTGWRAGEALQRAVAEVFHVVVEKTQQPLENPVHRVLRTGNVAVDVHTALVSRDGTLRPIANSAAPILDDRGRTLGVVLVFHDVSEQRLIEEVLGEQREWLETTLESIGDAVIATDVRGEIVFLNPVAERLTGWRAADARGRNCDQVFRVVDEKTRLPAPNPVRRAVSEGAVAGLSGHGVLVAADGTEHPIDDGSAPIRNRAGRVVGVVLVFRDVSERRRTEAERHAAAADRERLLESERTARAEAERANRLKDDFVAMVSHELRTPLNAILGWTRLLLENIADPDKLRHGLEVVERNTVLQAQLISDLLDMSRIVSGKLRLEVETVDLASVVEDAVHTVLPAAQAKGVEIRRDLAAALGTALGDPARLQQAVGNLLSNAIKFTHEGGTVTVTLNQSAPYAEIKVTDDGIGIQPDALPFVFERFRQGEAPTTRRHGGLGLGLAIVKQIVELHGGSVRAESAGEGTGASFVLTLPLTAVRTPDRGPTLEDRSALEPTSLERVKVLVVEDEPDTRELIERLLREQQADVLTAGSAGEALEVLGEAHPDILVSDIGLPDVDGYELMQRIRRLDPGDGGGIPAVALTAFARSEDRTRALRAGYQAHLAKPVEPAELVAAIARFANLPEARRKARSTT